MIDKTLIGLIVTSNVVHTHHIPIESANILSYRLLDNGAYYLSIGGAMSVIGVAGMLWGIWSTIKKNKDK